MKSPRNRELTGQYDKSETQIRKVTKRDARTAKSAA